MREMMDGIKEMPVEMKELLVEEYEGRLLERYKEFKDKGLQARAPLMYRVSLGIHEDADGEIKEWSVVMNEMMYDLMLRDLGIDYK